MSKKSSKAQAARGPQQKPPRQKPQMSMRRETTFGDKPTTNDDIFDLKKWAISIGELYPHQRNMIEKLREQFFREEITMTGRFRGRIEDDFLGGWDPRDIHGGYGSRQDSERMRRRVEHLARKEEDGDLQSRHLIPPEDRVGELVSRYGIERTLREIVRVMKDMLDADSVLDVVEADVSWERTRNEYYPVEPRETRCRGGGAHDFIDVSRVGEPYAEKECVRCGFHTRDAIRIDPRGTRMRWEP